MKNILKGISGLFFLMMILVSCSPDSVDHPSESGVPKISDINIKITVGQENVVTFEIENKEVVPVWYFEGSDPFFGNFYKKTFGKAGTYSVEVKVYNSNGISDGSVVKEFTLTENLLTQDLLYISGGTSKRWIMDKGTAGHIGCGPGPDMENSSGIGLDWWSAGPNEKAGTALYDDILTFTANYEYTYNPGPDGMVYVHESAPYKPEYATGNGDYDAPAEEMNTTFDFVTQGGELYLVFPKNTIVSFIANSQALDNPSYRILELSENVLEFCIFNNVEGWDGIVWHYRFIPYED